MPRRKESLLDSLMAAGAAMPWWLSLILAAVAYFLLHQVATMDVPKASGLQDLGASAASQFYRTLATFAQYLVPCALLVGAVAAFIRRRRDVKLYDGTRRDSSAERIEKLSWRQFERLLGEAFRRQGYRASDTPAGADGGVDLRLEKGGATFLVQCKHWKQSKVGVTVVRELNGVVAAQRAAGGFVVTSGTFTQQARDFAKNTTIGLVDGRALDRMLAQGERKECQGRNVAVDEPACPVCNAAMVKRQARRGKNKGMFFWGCRDYPSCRGTRALLSDKVT